MKNGVGLMFMCEVQADGTNRCCMLMVPLLLPLPSSPSLCFCFLFCFVSYAVCYDYDYDYDMIKSLCYYKGGVNVY